MCPHKRTQKAAQKPRFLRVSFGADLIPALLPIRRAWTTHPSPARCRTLAGTVTSISRPAPPDCWCDLRAFYGNLWIFPSEFLPRSTQVCWGKFRLRASFFLDAQKETKEALRGGGRIGFLRLRSVILHSRPPEDPRGRGGGGTRPPWTCVRPTGDDTPQPPYARRPAQLGDSLPAPTNGGPALARSCPRVGRRSAESEELGIVGRDS